MDVLSARPLEAQRRAPVALGAIRGAAVLSHWISASVNQRLEASGPADGFGKKVPPAGRNNDAILAARRRVRAAGEGRRPGGQTS